MQLSPVRTGGHTTIWTRPLAAFAPPGKTPGDAFYPMPLKEPAAGSFGHGSPRIATATPPTLILIGPCPENAQNKSNFLSSRRAGLVPSGQMVKVDMESGLTALQPAGASVEGRGQVRADQAAPEFVLLKRLPDCMIAFGPMQTERDRVRQMEAEAAELVRKTVLDELAGEQVRIYLFGSRATDRAGRRSDFDIAVLPAPGSARLKLAELRERLEELNIPYSVDLVDLSEASARFRQQVIMEGVEWTSSTT